MTHTPHTRRDFLKTGAAAAAIGSLPFAARAQNSFDPRPAPGAPWKSPPAARFFCPPG